MAKYIWHGKIVVPCAGMSTEVLRNLLITTFHTADSVQGSDNEVVFAVTEEVSAATPAGACWSITSKYNSYKVITTRVEKADVFDDFEQSGTVAGLLAVTRKATTDDPMLDVLKLWCDLVDKEGASEAWDRIHTSMGSKYNTGILGLFDTLLYREMGNGAGRGARRGYVEWLKQ